MSLWMARWRIFEAGVRFGQAAPTRLSGADADLLVAQVLQVEPEEARRLVAKWRTEEKQDWRVH